MRPRSFLFQFLILMAGFVLINMAVRYAARNAPAHELVRSINNKRNIHFTDLAIGNSLMQAGLQPEVFDGILRDRRVLQMSLGGTKPIENYATLRYYFDHTPATTPRPRTLIFGFYDRLLTNTDLLGWDDMMGNNAMVYYTDIETTLPFYAPEGGWKAWKYRLSAPFPVVTDRGQIWGKVEKLRRRLGGVGLPGKADNEFGRVGDMGGLEPDEALFGPACLRDARAGAPFSPPMEAIMKLCDQQKISVVFVSMPMRPKHRRIYYSTVAWSKYEAQLRANMKRHGAQYIDASTWIDDTEFMDNIHLKKPGGVEFTRRLATALQSVGAP